MHGMMARERQVRTTALDQHQPSRTALIDLVTGASLSVAELRRTIACDRETLQKQLLTAGDRVLCAAGSGLDIIPFAIACLDLDLHLALQPPAAFRMQQVLNDLHPKLVLSQNWPRRPASTSMHWVTLHEIRAGRGHYGTVGPLPKPSLDVLKASSPQASGGTWLTAATLSETEANLHDACSLSGEDVVFNGASPFTLDGLCSMLAALNQGAQIVLTGPDLLTDPDRYWAEAERAGATVCELPGAGLRTLVEADPAPLRVVPACVRLITSSSGLLPESCRSAAENLWQRPVHGGYGTPQAGYWAVHTSSSHPARLNADTALELAIRPLRTPLKRQHGGETGEIILRQQRTQSGGPVMERRTGDLGRLTGAGGLAIEGRIVDIAIRDGQAILLSDIDTVLRQHPAIRLSKTIHEQGQSPFEPVIAACASDAAAGEIEHWLASRLPQNERPDRIVRLDSLPLGPDLEVSVPTLRAMLDGSAREAVVSALTSRRFRRSPPYREGALRELTQTAIGGLRPLDFMMFWGCGPRDTAAEPDQVAMDALHELLEAVSAAAPIEARAAIIFTDVHATNNGHSVDHFNGYFRAVERLATGANVVFHPESAIWDRGGLSQREVQNLAATPEFETKWQSFALRDRFIRQASRHSKMVDPVKAARNYYATCLLEREVFKLIFPQSIFLTYNGPEFNECFPDLPTLYIYPGPRGRTDKPWFVHLDSSPAVSKRAA